MGKIEKILNWVVTIATALLAAVTALSGGAQ
jgi:hypothetical protein